MSGSKALICKESSSLQNVLLAGLPLASLAALLLVGIPYTFAQHHVTVNAGQPLALSGAPALQATRMITRLQSEPQMMEGARSSNANLEQQPTMATISDTSSLSSSNAVIAFFSTGIVLMGSIVALGAAAMAIGITSVATFMRKLLPSTPAPASIEVLSTAGEREDPSRSQLRQVVNTMSSADMKVLARGGSMVEVVSSKGIDEVAQAIRTDQQNRKNLSPKDVLLNMQRGNGRFWMGVTERAEISALQRRALIMAQAPTMCVLSCSDSRVPVELIFDQGLGEIFVVRTAGNILDSNAHGSIEFAVRALGCKVVLVIGHEVCGAVKGAISMTHYDIQKEPEALQHVLLTIQRGLDVNELNTIADTRSRDREAIVANVSIQVKKLQENPVLAEKVSQGQLLICGAFYEVSSGIVDFFSLDKNGFIVDI